MSEKPEFDPNDDLERSLKELFHRPKPAQTFVNDLERRLVAQKPEPPRLQKFLASLFSSTTTLAGSAAALALILALAWILTNLIPKQIPIALSSSTPTSLASVSPTPTVSPAAAPTGTPSAQKTPSQAPSAKSTATPAPSGASAPADPYAGWQRYTNTGYDFSLRYPPGWKLSESSHGIRLAPQPGGAVTLVIGFRRLDESVQIRPGDIGAGSLKASGQVPFQGRLITRDLLVSQEKVKAVFYNRGIEIPAGDVVFTFSLQDFSPNASLVDIPAGAQGVADRIVSSLIRGAGLGKVVYVLNGDLWVKSLPDGEPRRITRGGGLSQPSWSPSGSWLAARLGTDQVWALSADGLQSQGLNGGKPVHAFAWSPVKDRLAYVTGSGAEYGELRLAGGDGKDIKVLVGQNGSAAIQRIAWSPAGDWIAYQLIRRKPGQETPYVGLWTVSADGGRPVELYSGNPTLAGWTGDGRGLLFWDGGNTFSASLMADGAPLKLLPAAGGDPQTLAKFVLAFPDFVRPDPSGSARVAVITGGNREVWTNKVLNVFDDGNMALLTSSGTAASSPSWSPDGRQIAFVQAKDAGALSGGEPARLALMERKLWLRDLQTGKSRQLTTDPAYRDEYPLWTGDGASLLFVRMDKQGAVSLWLLPLSGGDPQEMVDGMSAPAISTDPQDAWFGYYGHIDWSQVFDWWR